MALWMNATTYRPIAEGVELVDDHGVPFNPWYVVQNGGGKEVGMNRVSQASQRSGKAMEQPLYLQDRTIESEADHDEPEIQKGGKCGDEE